MTGVVKSFLRSFAGGEVAPELYARIDLDKHQTGLSKALNFIVYPHGPAANRPGFQLVAEGRYPDDDDLRIRLIPFAYSADQTMMLEFGNLYVRFHTNGASLLEATKSITAVTVASPGVFTIVGHGYSTGDRVYLAGFTTMTPLNARYFNVVSLTADTFKLQDTSSAADIGTSAMGAYGGGGTAARVYTVTTTYLDAHLFDLHYAQSADVLTITHPTYETMELRRLGATNWTLTAASFVPAIGTPGVPTTTLVGPGGGTPISHTYVTTAVSADNYEESLASIGSAKSHDLTVAGNAIDVTPAVVAGAVRYNVYKLSRGGLYGFIGQSNGADFRDDNIVPDMSQTPPESSAPFTGAGNYPSTVTYMEQRRCFAATDNKPQNVWMTHSATEGNLSQSIPVRDSDAIIFRIAATQQNRIRHLVPLGDLIAITAGGEFRVYADGGGALTPNSVTPKPQSYVGCNNVQPAVAENSVLYVQAQGAHIREFAFAGEGISGALYKTNDISILAPHLFDGHEIVDLAYSRSAKCPTLWVVRDDGVLLGMTYVPGQNVRAWHQHTTDGLFESVACVAENGEDALYAVVRRSVKGQNLRFIERLHSRQFSALADAFFVDSGLTYNGAPATTISGLWHLIGETVSILADGAVHPPQVVAADATITLEHEASVVHVGLPYTANLRTLPLSWQVDGFGQGVMKNISKVHLRLVDSSGVHIGPTEGRLIEVKQRTTEPYGSPPAMVNGWKHAVVMPMWQDDGGVEVEQIDPLPVTIAALVMDVVAGG